MDDSEEHSSPTMDRSCDEEKETEWHSKRLKTCEVNRDFISDLPDPILVHILLFLPLKDAVKTVLLPRFGKMWLNMPVLDLDICGDNHEDEDAFYEICDYEEFMDIISQVWNHPSNSTLDEVRLRIPFPCTFLKNDSVLCPGNEDYAKFAKEKNAADQIEKLISYAISRKVKVLNLNFKACDVWLSAEQHHNLPEVFRSNHLTELWLAFCGIRSVEKLNLPALRVLVLTEVSLSDKVMAKMFLECPFLEDLSIARCYGLGNLNCENPNLKKLKIALGDEERKRLFISCPHVISLEMGGMLERVTLLNVSSLVNASISFSEGSFRCEERPYTDILKLLLKLRKCNNFSTRRWSIMVLSIWEFKTTFHFQYFEWKNISLRLDLAKWQLPGLSLLLKRSHRVETLDMGILSRDDQLFQRETAKWVWRYDFDGENYWDSQVVTFHCLETVTISGNVHEPYVVQLVKFLLKNAPKLQKMVIITKNPYSSDEHDRLSSEQLLELSRKLLTFPRASSSAMIQFS